MHLARGVLLRDRTAGKWSIGDRSGGNIGDTVSRFLLLSSRYTRGTLRFSPDHVDDFALRRPLAWRQRLRVDIQCHFGRGVTQQLLTVTISSEINVLVLGVMLVLFVVAAPEGLIGLLRRIRRREDKS